MIRPTVVFALAMALSAIPAYAQAGTETQPPAPSAPINASESAENPFVKGQETISLSASALIPLFIFPASQNPPSYPTLFFGGAFSFTYQYFIAQGLAIGGTIDGAFNGTVAGRSLFTAPLAFRVAYWNTMMPFEFFGAAELGAYIMRLDTKGMFGPFAKVGGGALWKSGPGWSIGLQAYYWFVPEIHTSANSAFTKFGNFLETGLVAVYHL